MNARLVLVALLSLSAAAKAGIMPPDKLPASLSLPQAVRLADGSVLPAGRYDVKIDYRGFGNVAELLFFQGGVLKGKAPAEARGFPSQAPAAVPLPTEKKLQKGHEAASSDVFPKIGDVKGESLDDKHKDTIGVKKPNPGGPVEFNWSKAGFPPGAAGKAVPSGHSVKLSFDSANSSAGFSALLPAVLKQE